jgi:cell volume regulation protein A
VFLSWAGLRGAIPIVLATIPLAADVPVPNAELLFDIVFVLVTALTLAQGPTLPWVARRLRKQSSGDGRRGKHPEWVAVDRVEAVGIRGA